MKQACRALPRLAAALTAVSLVAAGQPGQLATGQAAPRSRGAGLAPLAVDVVVAADGTYAVTVGGAPYLASAATSVRAGGRAYSTADGSLTLGGPPSARAAGSDGMGAFTRQELVWLGGGVPLMRTAVQVYAAAGCAVFEQSFPDGANGTAAPGGDADAVLSAWPAFGVDASDTTRGVVGFGGRFLEGSHAAAWGALASGGDGLASAGQHGGPMVIFDRASAAAVAVSSLSAHTVTVSALDRAAASLSYGVIGSVTALPPGFASRVIVAATAGGPTAGALRWGGLVLAYTGLGPRPVDATTQWLGYATDNGAYYYYKTAPGPDGKPSTYEDTLLAVVADARARGIPYKYMQLDSWWYQQGKGGGVVDWTATAKAFPHGLAWFHTQVGMPFYAHNRYWAAENVYATQNGGDYAFIVEPANQMAIPTEQRFWDDLLSNASAWGMQVYEQDWLFTEIEGLNATRESATLTETWLTQMATAASRVGATVQYCMSLGRLVMMATQLPAVTQFRAGDDYGPGQTEKCSFPYCVYYIGTTSLLGWALGVAPSKDGFWSAEVQPGSPFGHGNATEPYAAMEAAIAVLSTAPVQLDDGVGFTNVTLALATCTAGGRLLQPSRPATALDACFAADAFGAAAGPVATRAHNLPVQSTHTAVGARAWAHVLVIGLDAPAALTPASLPLDVDAGPLVAYAGWGERRGGWFDALAPFAAAAPLRLPAAPDPHDWALLHVAPVFASGWALLGEAAKLVPVSVWRVAAVHEAPAAGGVAVDVRGEPGEAVTLAFAMPAAEAGAWTVVTATCVLPASGNATVAVDAAGAAHCAPAA